MEEVKLNQKEIQQLIDLRSDVSNLYIQLGQLYIHKKEIIEEYDKKEKELLTDAHSLKEREVALYNSIGDKYGHGDVNLETGVFTPKKEV